MQQDKIKRDQTSNALPIGLALIVPLLLVAIYSHLLPFSNIFSTAMSSNNMLRDAEPVGMENYERLAEDEAYHEAIANTLPFVMQRGVIAVIVPLLIGGLIGLQAKAGRLLNRSLLSVLAVLIVPVALSVIWSIYLGPRWGFEPSPIFNDDVSLMNPDSALSLIQTLDMLLMASIAAVVGGTVHTAVMRGKRQVMTGVAIGIIGFIVASASGWLIFDLPFVMTNGGPLNSTTTYMLEVYLSGFQQFRIGYASAQLVPLGVGALVVGLIVGIVTVGFNLRIIQVSPAAQSHDGNNLLSLASVPLIGLLILSLGGYVLWALTLDTGIPADSQGRIDELVPIGQSVINTLSPLYAIWFIQLPMTFMAGIGLGFYRPFGKIGSNIFFVVLLMITLIPTEVLIFEWFQMSADTGMLNNTSMLGLPWMVNGFTLLVFKIFADGARDHYYAERDAGLSHTQAFGRRVTMPGIYLAITAGVVLSFISMQSLLWALISQNSQDNFTLPVQLMMARTMMAMDIDVLLDLSAYIILFIGVVFAVMFILIQIFILERFALASGGADLTETTPDDMSFDVVDADGDDLSS